MGVVLNALLERAKAGPGEAGVPGRAAPAPATWFGVEQDAPFCAFVLHLHGDAPLTPEEQLAAEVEAELELEEGRRPTLRAGRTYRFVVRPLPSAPGLGSETSRSMPLVADAVLGLAYAADPGRPRLRLDVPLHRLAATTPAAATHTFEVAIPAGCPASDGEIQLRYLLPGYRSERVAAVPVHVESAGGLRADDETFLLAAALPPEPPPREVAVLCIERGETADVVRMSGGAWDADGAWRRSLDRATLPAPPGALANLVNLDANAGLIVEAMRDYGSRVHELRRWLHGLVTGPHGTERVLLICDHTYARMPWEMLDVVVAGDDVPIGALLDVARWMPVPDVEGLMPLRLAEETHAGGVLSYVDVAGLRNAADEVAALQRLSRHRSETLDAFLRRLRDRPEDLGLLYLACHGNFDSDDPGAEGVVADEISLGDLEDAQRGVSLYELRRLRRFMARRPLLFVNACYSARMTEDGVFGLPGMLLSRVAAAYIGTLGPVGSIYASRVACRFLEAAARSQGVRPARFLRELREEAAARVAPSVDEPSRLDWWEFLFAFTYVLYGNPLARVALVAGGDVAADEGEVDDAATGGASTEGGP